MEKISVKKKNVTTFELVLFIFSMVFLVEFNGIDIRIPVSFFWIFKSILNNRNTITIKQIYLRYILIILSIIVYSLIIITINYSYDLFIPLRYLRAIYSLVVILFYITTHVSRIKPERLLNSIIYVLLIHALTIIFEILIPSVSTYVYIISGYSKKELGYRAAGLVSGYDFAGMYLNIGLFFSMSKLIISNQSKYFIFSLIFIISTFLTSRTSSLLLLVTLLILIVIAKEFKNRKITFLLSLIFYIIIIVIFAFFILSTEIASSMRTGLLIKFPALNELYNNFDSSYANYNIFEVVKEQLYLPENNLFIIGLGEKALTDPGYLNIIYSIGFIGLFLICILYISILLRNIRNIKFYKKSKNVINSSNIVLLYSLTFVIIISFIMELKLSFLFSTGIFEIMIILLVYTYEQVELKKI